MRSKIVLAVLFALVLTGFVSGPSLATGAVGSGVPAAGQSSAPSDVSPMFHGRLTDVVLPNVKYTLYQCPFDFCNPGNAFKGNRLHTICYVWGGTNTPNPWFWDLVYNETNKHVGFIHEDFLTVDSSTACN